MDPWDGIPDVDTKKGTNILRAREGSHLHHFFRGKNSDGNYIFLFQGDFRVSAGNVPTTRNITVETELVSKNVNQLVFTLCDVELKSLFRHLSLDLITAAAMTSKNDQTVADIILGRFNRWQSMLGKAKSELLSHSQILGLFGELSILTQVFFPNCGIHEAIESWCGPLGEEQDFAFNSKLLEVKSQMISKDSKIKISSAEQLDDSSGQIFLCHQTFSKTEETNNLGQSLNDLVNEVRAVLFENNTLSDGFESRLLELGYSSRSEYDFPKFIKSQTSFYDVTKLFPRITPAQLAPGISQVRYMIQLEYCKQFLIPIDRFKHEFFDEK